MIVASSTAAYLRQSRPDFRSTETRQSRFPPPHGFARRGLHRVWKEYHIFWIENCRSLIPKRPPHVHFGSKADIARARLNVRFTPPPKADIGTQSWNVRFVPNCDIRSFDIVDCVLVNGVSKTQMSPTAQGVCDALNCLWTIRIGRGQFGELLEIHQRALQIVLPFP